MSVKLQVVAVHDSAVESFGRPIFVAHVGAAVRSFGDECRKADSDLHKHPEHFALYHLGEWEEDTGAFRSIKPVKLVDASSFKE